jgi:hypothetical protein
VLVGDVVGVGAGADGLADGVAASDGVGAVGVGSVVLPGPSLGVVEGVGSGVGLEPPADPSSCEIDVPPLPWVPPV